MLFYVYHKSIVMEKSETYFTELVASYFSGEATAGDIQLLSGWVASDPEKQKQFEEYRRTWTLLEEERIGSRVDIEAEWKEFSSKKTKRSFSFTTAYRIAALVVLLLVPAWFIWRYVSGPEMIRIAAQNGPVGCTLPDGTLATLKKGAVIEYPGTFSGKTRPVGVSGEVCFEVTHDPEKPFIVETGNVRVEVLGTVFYVFAPEGQDNISVILTSGSVATYFKGEKSRKVLLGPGETAEISVAEHSIAKHEGADPNLLAWKTRKMVFENATLEEIVTLLNEVYSSRIIIEDRRLADCRVTATFDGQSLESVLNVIRATLGIVCETTSEGIVISGKACD
jgi:transmembrane sensor